MAKRNLIQLYGETKETQKERGNLAALGQLGREAISTQFDVASFLTGGLIPRTAGDLIDPSKNIVLSKGTPRLKKKFKGKVLSILQGASGNNYGHWILEMLPKIKICSEHYNLNDLNYIYTPKIHSFQFF